MYKPGIALTLGSLLMLTAAGSSYAGASGIREPLSQAKERVDVNLQKNPDNEGLQDSAGRLQVNQERIEGKRKEQKTKRRVKKVVKIKRTPKQPDEASEPDKPIHQERTERMEKTRRPGTMEHQNRKSGAQ